MSLICHECEFDIQPSEEFPGREGFLVYPVVTALIYAVDKDGGIKYRLGNVESKNNKSLCFGCVEKRLPESGGGAEKSLCGL